MTHTAIQFDTNPQGAQGLIPELSPIDQSATGALTYSAFDYITGPGQLIVAFPSPPNVAGAGALSELREGKNPGWAARSTPGPNGGGRVTTRTFNQKSIAYACVVNLQNSVSPPTTCTIQAAGVREDGSTVVKELVFNPGPNQDIPGNFSVARFTPEEEWTGLTRVDVQLVNSDVPETVTAIIIDNNEYEVCE